MDLFVGSSLVDIYAKCGLLIDAKRIFEMMVSHKTVSWSSLIAAYTEHGLAEDALDCFRRMEDQRLSRDEVTFVSVVKSCGLLQVREKTFEVCHEIIVRGYDRGRIIANSVVDMYAKCGMIAEAYKVFDKLPHRDVVTWTSVMLGFVQSGEAHNAINLYEKMCEIGLHPSKHTLVTLLKACTQLKNLQIGQEINDCIVQRGLDMDLFVGSSLVDIYAKCGLLIDAKRIFEMMVSHNTVSWSSLIAAYTEHGPAEDALDFFRRMED
ncbi:hypothetical protein KP509_25G053700 [Ceratopteris richardii]|uniref:Pentatricopeptide repeat-containing protein n=1 Tax=Ceratopteris richardii TaxID=49495 RepID=A0A8T2RSY3_CERRI|nr:hypothetical protein KP509_25G053700 [Ceratopteris richardii]